MNKSIALTKQKKYDEAVSALNKAIKMQPDYAKAIVKRGEVYTLLGDHDDAVRDFAAANQIAKGEFGVEAKLKAA